MFALMGISGWFALRAYGISLALFLIIWPIVMTNRRRGGGN